MPCIRRRAVTSFWAVLLLVFAASPLTAPFSSCSPSDFLNERELHSAALLQAKNVKDDSTAPMGGAPILLFSNLERRVLGECPALEGEQRTRLISLKSVWRSMADLPLVNDGPANRPASILPVRS